MRSPLTKKPNFRYFVAVVLLSLSGCGSSSDCVLEETFERLYKIQPTADISIQNRDGAILLYGSNTDQMEIHVTKKAYSSARLREIVADVSTQPTSVSINIKRPPKRTWSLVDRSGTVDCTVVVPATANVSSLQLDAGEMLVDGMHGRSLRASLGDGRMFVHNCFTESSLSLRRGNLAVSYDWWANEAFSVQANINRGNAWLFLPSTAAFHLVADTARGKIANDFDNHADVRPASEQARKIDMLVHGGGKAAIKVQMANGDVNVVMVNP